MRTFKYFKGFALISIFISLLNATIIAISFYQRFQEKPQAALSHYIFLPPIERGDSSAAGLVPRDENLENPPFSLFSKVVEPTYYDESLKFHLCVCLLANGAYLVSISNLLLFSALRSGEHISATFHFFGEILEMKVTCRQAFWFRLAMGTIVLEVVCGFLTFSIDLVKNPSIHAFFTVSSLALQLFSLFWLEAMVLATWTQAGGKWTPVTALRYLLISLSIGSFVVFSLLFNWYGNVPALYPLECPEEQGIPHPILPTLEGLSVLFSVLASYTFLFHVNSERVRAIFEEMS